MMKRIYTIKIEYDIYCGRLDPTTNHVMFYGHTFRNICEAISHRSFLHKIYMQYKQNKLKKRKRKLINELSCPNFADTSPLYEEI